MAEYKEVEETVEVPAGAGARGFLHTIESILKRPRLQGITVDARGRVTYRYYVREGEEQAPLPLNFDALMPYAVIRNGKVVEPPPVDDNAAIAMSQLFNLVAIDHLNPVAFVAGANTTFWNWYEASAKVNPSSHEELYGLPFLTDRLVEDRVLLFCAAYAKTGSLVDTVKSYKIVIPEPPAKEKA